VKLHALGFWANNLPQHLHSEEKLVTPVVDVTPEQETMWGDLVQSLE